MSLAFVFLVIITTYGITYYNNQYYSQRLNNAIEQNDENQVAELLKLPFGNINSAPKLSKLLIALFEKSESFTPLQNACFVGNIEIVKMLIEKGADVNYVIPGIASASPLICAVRSNEMNLEIVKLLIEHGAEASSDVLFPLAESIYEIPHSLEILDYLEKAGVNIKTQGSTGNLLNLACRNEKTELIRYLIEEKDFELNEVSSIGRTPLIDFCYYNKKRNVVDFKVLLDNGADKAFKDSYGKTAYDYALEYADDEFTELSKP